MLVVKIKILVLHFILLWLNLLSSKSFHRLKKFINDHFLILILDQKFSPIDCQYRKPTRNQQHYVRIIIINFMKKNYIYKTI